MFDVITLESSYVMICKPNDAKLALKGRSFLLANFEFPPPLYLQVLDLLLMATLGRQSGYLHHNLREPDWIFRRHWRYIDDSYTEQFVHDDSYTKFGNDSYTAIRTLDDSYTNSKSVHWEKI